MPLQQLELARSEQAFEPFVPIVVRRDRQQGNRFRVPTVQE